MSSVGARLISDLRSVARPGDYCVGGSFEIFLPAIDVDGVGRLSFPVPPSQSEALVGVAAAAPYGRGEQTLVDRDVRRTWQVDSTAVRIGGRRWEKTLADLVARAALGLGVDGAVSADFYKLLVYDSGSFFLDHRDTEKVPGMFATMVVVLPSLHEGGALVVKHAGRETTFDLRPEEPSEIGFAAFYADCVHEVRPVTAGFRVVLVYNLRFGDGSRPTAPDYREEQTRAAETLRSWASDSDEPAKLIMPLEHAYTPAELSFAALKGADAGAASVLVDAAARAGCDIHLALVSIEESGSAEHSYVPRRWRGDEDDDEDEFEVVEVIDRTQILSEWRRPDGGEDGLGEIPFEEEELCPPDAFEDLAPDEVFFHEATGNEGASFERSYRRAGLVLWPAARRLTVLNAGGLEATLPYLEGLAARWEAAGRPSDSPAWAEADALSGPMLASWPLDRWREDDPRVARMLEAQIRLGNGKRIDAILGGLCAEGRYAAGDNDPIVRAAALLAPARATELLAAIMARNAATRPDACADLLMRVVATPAGDPGPAGAALIDGMPSDSSGPVAFDPWTRPSRPTSRFIVDLVTAASRIDPELALRAIERVLASPKTYEPDEALTPAALALAGEDACRFWPAAARLREAALDHLRGRIALPLAPPRDWARDNPLKCRCAECAALGAFLVAPDQRQWRLKAVQERRLHVESSVRNTPCDVDLATERRGSPHTLVATKNDATFRRRADQRRRDLEHVSALGR